MAGLDATGFTGKTVQEIKTEMEVAVRADVSPNVNTSSASVVGAILGILASQLAELWELAEEVYASAFPDSASGSSLVEVASITGTEPSPGTPSTVYAEIVTDADAVTIPAGSVASVAGNPAARFAFTADLVCPTAGTYHAWLEAEDIGPTIANANTLTVIETPIAGWQSVDNDADAELGTDPDDDAALRLRRERELAGQGTSPADALAADLRQVTDVESVTVIENVTDYTDSAGRPPHSVEALVLGGADADIASVIWADKAAGIQTYGAESVAVVDGEGNTQTVHFSRPTQRNVYIDVDVQVDAETFPADGDDLISAAIAAWGDANLKCGDDVYVSRIVALAFEVPGVVNVTEVRLGFAPDPGGTANLTIAVREIARFDTGRIVVAEV